MTTQLTPPPVTPPEPAPQSDSVRVGTRALAIVVAVVGAAGLLGSGVITAISTVRHASQPAPVTQSLGNLGSVEQIDIDTSRGDLRIAFGEGAEATLESRSTGGSDWRLEREGDTLVVAESTPFGWGTGWSWGWLGEERSATLTLPADLEGAGLDIDLEAGQVIAEGAFGDVSFDIGAGYIEIEGSAKALDAKIGAGQAVVELADVRQAMFELSAGHADATLTGAAPQRVGVDVSAGALDLTLPDVPYAVVTEREIGQVNTNDLRQALDAANAVEVRVSAGYVDLWAE